MSSVKIGVCEFCMPCEGTLAIRMAHEAGFEGMQLGDLGGAAKRFPFSDPFIQEQYLKEAEENQIELQAMHLQALFNSRFMLETPGSEKAKIARESLKTAAMACRQMKIPVIMVTGTMISSQEQFDNLVASLKYGLNVSQENGIQLVMETDLNPEQFHRLREQVGDGLKLCFDMMNLKVYGMGEPSELIEKYGFDLIDHFHSKDCVANENGYFTRYTTPFRLIGHGKSGFWDCADVLKRLDYKGWVISESFYFSTDFGGRDYISLAKEDVETLRKAFS